MGCVVFYVPEVSDLGFVEVSDLLFCDAIERLHTCADRLCVWRFPIIVFVHAQTCHAGWAWCAGCAEQAWVFRNISILFVVEGFDRFYKCADHSCVDATGRLLCGCSLFFGQGKQTGS